MNGIQTYSLVGGTSLATPVFSSEWALLDQTVGFSLGQSAPYLAEYAKSGAITDVLAPSSRFSVHSSIKDANGVTVYSSEALTSPETDTSFMSAIDQGVSNGGHYVLSFGTDSSLAVTQGWDPVRGWGTLNKEAIFTVSAI